MKTLAFFNNKGGVGKTTLVCNLAHYLATVEKKKVLVVDLDPQCNTTQLILSPEVCADLYWNHSGGYLNGEPTGEHTTIYDAVRPLEEGDATVGQIKPSAGDNNRFGIDLIPGHPRMSVFEDLLGQWFRDATSGDIAGLRKTLWLGNVIAAVADAYDIVIFDVGPSLGSLNRSVLAASDYFVTPMGADIFSVVALRNISGWMAHWHELFAQGVQLCEKNNPGAASRFNIPVSLPIMNGFAGYTVQQYSTVSVRGERRATVAYDQIINQIPEQVVEHMQGLAIPGLTPSDLSLGDVPNLRSLVPLAQSANAPLAMLTSKDGLAGGQYTQQKSYSKLVNNVGRRLTENCLDGK